MDSPSRGKAPPCPACSCPGASGALSASWMASCNTANPTRAQVGPTSLISVTWEISETFLEVLWASRICRGASGVRWTAAQGHLRPEKGWYEECANPALTCLKFAVVGAGDSSCQVFPSGSRITRVMSDSAGSLRPPGTVSRPICGFTFSEHFCDDVPLRQM